MISHFQLFKYSIHNKLTDHTVLFLLRRPSWLIWSHAISVRLLYQHPNDLAVWASLIAKPVKGTEEYLRILYHIPSAGKVTVPYCKGNPLVTEAFPFHFMCVVRTNTLLNKQSRHWCHCNVYPWHWIEQCTVPCCKISVCWLVWPSVFDTNVCNFV